MDMMDTVRKLIIKQINLKKIENRKKKEIIDLFRNLIEQSYRKMEESRKQDKKEIIKKINSEETMKIM